MKQRLGVYETYWYFAAERQNIFFNRLYYQKKPYTDDLILQRYKFCNTYRATDRVSQFLIHTVIYSGHWSEENLLFRILLFRLFNKVQTWEKLEKEVGEISLSTFSPEKYAIALEKIRQTEPISYEFPPKWGIKL